MARIIAGIGSSHVPAIGAALDNGKTEEPYWKRIFSGFEKSQGWMRETKPDVAIIVYNDHASAFSVEMIATSGLVSRIHACDFSKPEKIRFQYGSSVFPLSSAAPMAGTCDEPIPAIILATASLPFR